MAQEKIDLYKVHEADYAAPRAPALVTVGKAKYLAIAGQGAPGSETFSAAIGALYGVAYTAKMTRKFSGGQDYVVCKLEAQWWGEDGPDFSAAPPEAWRWKLMIRTPDFVTRKDLAQAINTLLKRGKETEVERVALESVAEGRCVQMLHVGPYEKEPETIDAMKAFAASRGLQFRGLHHEIYLSDPRRVAPAKLKTILRMPVGRQTSARGGSLISPRT
jgi:hypothetical protein